MVQHTIFHQMYANQGLFARSKSDPDKCINPFFNASRGHPLLTSANWKYIRLNQANNGQPKDDMGRPGGSADSISPALSSVVVQLANSETLQLLSIINIQASSYQGGNSLAEAWLSQIGDEVGLKMAHMQKCYQDRRMAFTVMLDLSIHLAIVHLYQTQQYSEIKKYLQLPNINSPELAMETGNAAQLQNYRLDATYFFLTLVTLDENDAQVLELVQALQKSPNRKNLWCYKMHLVGLGLRKQTKYLENLVKDKNVWLKSKGRICQIISKGLYWFRLSSHGELGVGINLSTVAPELAEEAFMKSKPANHYPIKTLAKFEPKQSLLKEIGNFFTQRHAALF
ncbi:hypothetical protein BJ085DRAFT_30030 [Dimargaris cristalligena]|uniref:Uncharacterized protein n=1 Tax=Dimargaris cristalligena TaxID=215637 RepID=A0A4P9ZW35_9FUNG|nr:hypothetical protein BJ085DRAFT_30030 [Dimargaris cristalligena]|eukprot:RKP37813.1 hypothetical protein BJ085DRAFT_30030 [Dimargaris cristalligena]